MKLTVLGCGDAFGSGGRLQTCYHVDCGDHRFLVDCGATSIIGLNRQGLDPNAISTIFISHLHGDHFAGLVWWLLHSQHVAKRTVPLHIVGPIGIEARFKAAAEALFPGSTGVSLRFAMTFEEFADGTTTTVGPVRVTPFEVRHPSGAPPYALRFEIAGKTLSFTGDTEWVDNVVSAGKDADLYIMECYAPDGPVRYHMSWKTISENLSRIGAKRVMLTHMNASMLAVRESATAEHRNVLLAEDGLVVDI